MIVRQKTSVVNELRYQLFCSKRGELESSQLPPYKDCLVMDTRRANYQAAIWNRCLDAQADIPNPIHSGWTLDNYGDLVIEWMNVPAAPEAVLNLLSCNCLRSCKLSGCYTCMIECNVLWIYDKYSRVSNNQFCTDSSRVPCNFLELVEVTSESGCICCPHISSHCPLAMAGLIANSLLVSMPYSDNWLALFVVLVHRSLEIIGDFMTRENGINLALFVV